MTETSYYWGGTTIGDASLAPYSDDDWSDVWRKHFQADRTLQGVIPAYLGELAVTNPAGMTIRVATGGALVDGKFYENTATVDFTVAAPGAGYNYYSIVLRKTWSTQTVRLVKLGPDTVSMPVVTQDDTINFVWEILLAWVAVDNASAITITDKRRYAPVTETMILLSRQGGSGSIWAMPGSSNHSPGAFEVQAGVAPGAANATGSITVTFARPFKVAPMVFVSVSYVRAIDDADNKKLIAQGGDPSLTDFKIYYMTVDGSTPDANWGVSWMALA